MDDPVILYIATALIVLSWIMVSLYVRFKVISHPPGNPKEFRNKPKGDNKRVICIGDSITQATSSYDYVGHLNEKLKKDGLEFINAGVNSDLAWNVLQRLDELIELDPDYITILIGINDAAATLSKRNEKGYRRAKKLPRQPTAEWFRENMSAIIKRLQDETTAQIALISPPLIGEDPDEESNKRTAEFSAIIRDLAKEYNLTYLPLNERERELIESLNHICRTPYRSGSRLIRRSAFKHYVFGKSWDQIAEKNRFLLTHDLMHKNSKGGKIIVHLIERFLSRTEDKKEVLEEIKAP